MILCRLKFFWCTMFILQKKDIPNIVQGKEDRIRIRNQKDNLSAGILQVYGSGQAI